MHDHFLGIANSAAGIGQKPVDNLAKEVDFLRIKNPKKHANFTSLERDGDGSSDEEESQSASRYQEKHALELLRKDPQFNATVEKCGVSLSDFERLFCVHAQGVSRLYSPTVNEVYYKQFKPLLGKFSISEETNIKDFKIWLSLSIKTRVAQYFFNQTDLEDTPGEFQEEVKKWIKPFVAGLLEDTLKLRLFLKRMPFDTAAAQLAELLKLQDLKLIKKALEEIKKTEKIKKPANASDQELLAHIASKSPIPSSDAWFSNDKKKDTKAKIAILRKALQDRGSLSEELDVRLFELSLAAFLAEKRAHYRIYFERDLVAQLPSLTLGSEDHVNLAVTLRMLNRFEKNQRRSLENLKAIYTVLGTDVDTDNAGEKETNADPSILANHAIHQFSFGFGVLHNRSSISAKTLGRNEFVVLGGAYKNIVKHIERITQANTIFDADIARWLEQAYCGKVDNKTSLYLERDGKFIRLDPLLEKALKIKELIGHMAFLLFFIEPMRNPAASIFSEDSCFLVKMGVYSWEEMLAHHVRVVNPRSGKEKEELVSGGLHPMTHVEIVESARFFLKFFMPYLPFPYQYEGEIAEDKIQLFSKKAAELTGRANFVRQCPELFGPLIREYGWEQTYELTTQYDLDAIVGSYNLKTAFSRVKFAEIWSIIRSGNFETLELLSSDNVKEWLEDKAFDIFPAVIDYLSEHAEEFDVNILDLYEELLTDDDAISNVGSDDSYQSDEVKKRFPFDTLAAQNFEQYAESIRQHREADQDDSSNQSLFTDTSLFSSKRGPYHSDDEDESFESNSDDNDDASFSC